MNELRIKSLLLQISEDLSDIDQFIRIATKGEFMKNSMMRKAVCMSLLNIGEAVHSLPKSFTDKYPNIPWNSIIGLRNRTAHGYHTLDDEIIWDIAKNDLTELCHVVSCELHDRE